ncbi:MAG: D-alanyl-D-alanine carboxypeptidase, partial [Oscillospiraceae bacterium]|nr:D-alanyl-D-alanine carboxypeptidase [Oscillospiraceae bacterium]
MRKIKIIPIFLILLILFGLFSSLAAFALEEPQLSSRAAMVLSMDTGEVFYSKNPDEKIYPASTTKIMTVLLAVEAIERGEVRADDVVTASNNITFDLISDGSTAGISPGEAMTLESVLYCAMVSSANEACNIIAEYISGSVSDFVDLMNNRAISLGCSYTHFANTHGLPNDNHYTTCRDFSKIAAEASKHELFMKICSTASIEIPKTNKSPARVLNNSNALICTDSIYGNKYYYDKAAGMKTGFTSSAGYCLVSTAADSATGISLIALVFGGNMSQASDGYSYSNFSDSITLYDWVFNNYSYREILSSANNIASLQVKMSDDADYVNLRPDTSISVLLPNDFRSEDIEQKITPYNTEI